MLKLKHKKAFTLIELLAVIAILGVLLLIAVPSAMEIINENKKKAFFTSVSNIVNSLKPTDTLEENSYCIYDYSKDKENQTSNIKSLFVLLHQEDGKNIYSVFAKYDDQNAGIDIYDFSTLNINNSKEWAKTPEYSDLKSEKYKGEDIKLLSATEVLIKQLYDKSIPESCYLDVEVS